MEIFMENPLVSVIVRTCGRPDILKEALKSIKRQTYSNIETIIIEDGENVSEQLIKDNFSDLNIVYHATGIKRGRCRVGNIGMAKANGKYLNFLDDDDYFYVNHIATLVERLETSECKAAYAIAEEHQIQITGKNSFRVKRKLIRYKQPYNKLLLCYMNYIPIQSILFKKELYEQYGGLDEELKVMEDWDLWVRYSAHCNFLFVPTITSVYHTPYKGKNRHSRASELHKAEYEVIQKHSKLQMTFDAEQLNREMDYILNVFNKKGFLVYMQKIRNFLLYGDI